MPGQSLADLASLTDQEPCDGCWLGVCSLLATWLFASQAQQVGLVKTFAKVTAVVCLFSIILGEVYAASAADVEVRLNDGRMLRGSVIENLTSKEQLALELRSSGITIRRTLGWKQIADWKIVPPVKRILAPAVVPQPVLDEKDKLPGDNADPVSMPLSQLLVRADPVSTFGRIDWDSLRVTLRGVDIHGDRVPLFGTLKVTLWGQKRVSPEARIVRHPFVTEANYGSRFLSVPSNSYAYQHPFVASPNPTVELGSWTRGIGAETRGGALDSAVDERVRLANPWRSTENWQEARVGSRQDGRRAESRSVDGHDSVLLLPLQRPLPDHDVATGTFGEVTVELLMPGVGVFEANAPEVALSHQSGLRRDMLDRDGSRFYPNESTTDSPQTTRPRNRFLWPGASYGPVNGELGP